MSLAEQLFMFTPVAAVAALVFAFTKSAWISKQEVGTDKMSTIAGHIRDGAMAFLSREYKILAVFALVVAVFLGYSGSTSAQSHWLVAVAFILVQFARDSLVTSVCVSQLLRTFVRPTRHVKV